MNINNNHQSNLGPIQWGRTKRETGRVIGLDKLNEPSILSTPSVTTDFAL